MLFDEPEYAAPVTIRWPARVAAIGVVVSLMTVTGSLWYTAIRPPSAHGTMTLDDLGLGPIVVGVRVALALIEGVFLFLTWRPPRSRVVGFAAAVVLALAVVLVIGDVVVIVRAYLRI